MTIPAISTASTNITIGSGPTDEGAWQRAVEVAVKLHDADRWDGVAPLTLHDPYRLHQRLFGIEHLDPAALELGKDYEILAHPAETPDQPADTVETLVFNGWTCYLTYKGLLPPLTAEEYADLKSDIEQHGILVPVLLSQTGRDRHYHVLDGQHRLRIAADLGLDWMAIPKNYRNLLTPDQREDLALNLNLHRRHLTPEQRRDLALTFRQSGLSYREIADKLGVGASTALRDVKSGVPDETPDKAVEGTADGALPETITGRDGKRYAASQPAHTPTDEDRARIKMALADGELHRAVLEQRSLLSSRAFAATLQLMQDTGEILRAGLIYRLPDLPEITPASRDAKKLYAWLVERSGWVGTADATAACKLTADAFIRAANLLHATQRLDRKAVGGHIMIAAIVPDAAPEPGPEPPTPWKDDEPDRADVVPETDEAKITHDAEMAVEAAEAVHDQASADPTPAQDNDIVQPEPNPLPPMTVGEASALICDELKKLPRYVFRGELFKWAGVDAATGSQALQALVDEGIVVEIVHKGQRRYQLKGMSSPDAERRAADLDDDLQRLIDAVDMFSGEPLDDLRQASPARLNALRERLTQTTTALAALTAQLGDIDRTLAALVAPAESVSV